MTTAAIPTTHIAEHDLTQERPVAARWHWALLATLYAFTALALAGFGAFAVNPERLAAQSEWAIHFFGRAFKIFAHGQTWLAFGVLAAVLLQRAGTRWLLPFTLIYAISLSSELAGTTWGIPFGAYSYSTVLAPMWLDRVPLLIPASWFYMAVPSFALAALTVKSSIARIGVGSLVLLSWDLALDPAMSYATRYWEWGETGPYYGMPWLNLFGWYVTGVVLMWVMALFRAERWTARISPRWWMAYYGAVLMMPLGMCIAAGLWGAVAATALVLGLLAWIMIASHRRQTALVPR